nr:Ancylostoma secreted protein [Haemonchus contortus]
MLLQFKVFASLVAPVPVESTTKAVQDGKQFYGHDMFLRVSLQDQWQYHDARKTKAFCDSGQRLSKLSTIPIAAEFELWWGNHDFGAFINSTAVYDPNFDYTVFSQLVSGYAVSIGCTDTCYGQKQVYCAFDVCTAMTYFGMIYEAGSGPCMVDSDCTTFPGSTCNTKNGLCVKNPNTPLCPPNV